MLERISDLLIKTLYVHCSFFAIRCKNRNVRDMKYLYTGSSKAF